jgi:hypothetical protein
MEEFMDKESYTTDLTAKEVRDNCIIKDSMQLRELELYTQYELKHLDGSLEDLKRFVRSNLNRESSRFDTLNRKVSYLMFAVLLQLAGVDMSALATLASVFPL